MAAIARVIWPCACVRYWIYRGVATCASVLKWERTLGIRYVVAWPSPSLLISYFVWVIAAPGNNEVAD